jgi:hypothetical protein
MRGACSARSRRPIGDIASRGDRRPGVVLPPVGRKEGQSDVRRIDGVVHELVNHVARSAAVGLYPCHRDGDIAMLAAGGDEPHRARRLRLDDDPAAGDGPAVRCALASRDAAPSGDHRRGSDRVAAAGHHGRAADVVRPVGGRLAPADLLVVPRASNQQREEDQPSNRGAKRYHADGARRRTRGQGPNSEHPHLEAPDRLASAGWAVVWIPSCSVAHPVVGMAAVRLAIKSGSDPRRV